MSTITEYFDSLRGESIAVIGMGVSNTPLIKMMLRAGLKVTVCDKSSRERVEEQVAELESLGAKFQLGEEYLNKLYKFEVIFRTPGLSPNNPALQEAAQRGSVITSEMELFFDLCPCRILAVTGSDGKTTTTTLISEFLKEAGYNVYVGGNIGKPLLPDVAGMVPEDMVVLELSSFQLMSMKRSPHIAVFTNLSPNHLDYHHTMEEYTSAKLNIFCHQDENGRAVFNYDNDITRELAHQAPGSMTYFSRRNPMEEGVYLRDNAIWLNNTMGNREVLPLADIQIPGVHNIENYMAAIAMVEGLVSDDVIRQVAKNFGGVEHRIELVRIKDGVRFYNDSIASSPSRTIAGLRSFPEKVILIAGGYDKHIPYDVLGPEICAHVKTLILGGVTGPLIREAVEMCPEYDPNALEILDCGTFEPAVRTAAAVAKEGDIVLMSPASAAFDQFKNFMVRGEFYKKLVKEL